ncbi:right-handed parallel beta-helix repeat-containing protein [Agrilutibacter solisilvae]|uniref:Right-handed parallel beta-helix repeat-containing protein n=1 Tax=Agrilutibacter solisilvae TaxID=2763317 RepID=A0A975AS67_9GAMM|nr:right-handed parallel beta-helix repeat-containing protein [Lysobacter solisilvae]QSX77963.1 right-handed parallel beta-helix repeat-containing protein [Lysobacter solisilvae]
MINPLRSLLIGALLLSPLAARAETHATCAGFIDSLPTVIDSQGTWCLRHDLSTAITVGTAIEITTNNVTIDCNNFKVGGLAAGISSKTSGIRTSFRQNITVRNCNLRGFFIGINIYGGSGHLVEDNRLDNNTLFGMYLFAEAALVQRNRVFDTGGSPGEGGPTGIWAVGDIIDNVVSGVFGDAVNTSPTGIMQTLDGGRVVQGNRVNGLVTSGTGTARGISASSFSTRVQGNHITAQTMTPGIGLDAASGTSFCLENTVSNFQTSLQGCGWSVGNLALNTP